MPPNSRKTKRRPTAAREVNLADIDGPLRFYSAHEDNGYVVLVHQDSGSMIRVASDTYRMALEGALVKSRNAPPARISVAVLERLLPNLCHACGELTSGGTICEPCRSAQIDDLVRISTSKLTAH